MHRTLGSLFAIIAVFAAAPSARANVDEQCMERWERAFTAQTLGAQCKWLDNNATGKLTAAQERNLTCAQSAATDAEKDDIKSLLDASKADVKKSLTNAPCGNDARRFYDSQVQSSGQ